MSIALKGIIKSPQRDDQLIENILDGKQRYQGSMQYSASNVNMTRDSPDQRPVYNYQNHDQSLSQSFLTSKTPQRQTMNSYGVDTSNNRRSKELHLSESPNQDVRNPYATQKTPNYQKQKYTVNPNAYKTQKVEVDEINVSVLNTSKPNVSVLNTSKPLEITDLTSMPVIKERRTKDARKGSTFTEEPGSGSNFKPKNLYNTEKKLKQLQTSMKNELRSQKKLKSPTELNVSKVQYVPPVNRPQSAIKPRPVQNPFPYASRTPTNQGMGVQRTLIKSGSVSRTSINPAATKPSFNQRQYIQMLQNSKQQNINAGQEQQDNCDLDDDDDNDDQRPDVNASGFIGTLGSKRMDSQSRQETEVYLKPPAISNQSVFYKHKRDQSFENSRNMNLDNSRNHDNSQSMEYSRRIDVSQIFENKSTPQITRNFDKEQLYEALQKEAEENEQLMIKQGYLPKGSRSPKAYERLHELAKQKQLKRLQLYQKHNPKENLDFEKVNDILGSAQYLPKSTFNTDHKRNATASVAFGSGIDRSLIPKAKEVVVDPVLVNQLLETDKIEIQGPDKKVTVQKFDQKYNQLLAKKIQVNEKVARLKKEREEKELMEQEMLKNKNLMRKASANRQREVVNRFEQYKNKYQENRQKLKEKYDKESQDKLGILFKPQINRDYRPKYEQEYKPEVSRKQEYVLSDTQKSPTDVIYEDERELLSSKIAPTEGTQKFSPMKLDIDIFKQQSFQEPQRISMMSQDKSSTNLGLNSEQFSELEAFYHEKIKSQTQNFGNDFFKKKAPVPKLDFDPLDNEQQQHVLETPVYQNQLQVTPDYNSSQIEFKVASDSHSKKRDKVEHNFNKTTTESNPYGGQGTYMDRKIEELKGITFNPDYDEQQDDEYDVLQNEYDAQQNAQFEYEQQQNAQAQYEYDQQQQYEYEQQQQAQAQYEYDQQAQTQYAQQQAQYPQYYERQNEYAEYY